VAHLIKPQRMLARKPIAFCVVRTEDVFVGGAGLYHVWGVIQQIGWGWIAT
jgi:hypothetical protein